MAAATGSSLQPARIETTFGYVRARVARSLARISTNTGQPLALDIEVLSGAHAGCRTRITAPAFSIGSDLNHDIMLVDSCVEGSEVIVAGRSTMLGPVVAVRTVREDAALDGEPIVNGLGFEKLPCTIRIGSVDLRVGGTQAEPGRVRRYTTFVAIGALAVAGLTMLLGPQVMDPAAAGTRQSGTPDLVGPGGLDMAAQPNAFPATPPKVTETVEKRIETRIAGASLDDHVTLEAESDGTLVLEGAMPEGLWRDWTVLRNALDAEPYSGRLVSRVARAPALADVPAIAIVRLQPEPQLILANGDVRGVDDYLVSNWVITAIGADGMTVSRAGEEVDLSY